MTAPSDVASFRFSHDDLLRPRGLVIWREVIGRTLARLDLSVLPDRLFHSEARVRSLTEEIRVGHHMSAGMRIARTPDLLTDANDDLVLYLCTSGSLIATQHGRETTLEKGDAVLLSHAEVGAVTVPSASRSLMVRLPHRMLAPMVPDVDDAVMRPIPRNSEALALLALYADALATASLTMPALRQLVAAHVRDLVTAALSADGDGAHVAETWGIRAARMHAIKVDIEARLDHDDLSVSTVAARQGVSPRYIQALFEDEGTTFSQFVRDQRLQRVHHRLADPQLLHRPISEIAFETGFGDLSHFNRAFRRRYGMTPSDVRAAMLHQMARLPPAQA
jgi:AraC-like DNA-binding protein